MPKKTHIPKPIVPTIKISKKERKSVISDFHVLLKQKETLYRDNKINPTAKKDQLEQIEKKITQLGGLQRYQNASLFGVAERKFDTSKWCIQQLKDSGLYKKLQETVTAKGKLKVLDCGSITDSYRKHSHVFDVSAIDLNPRLPTVQKVDFFEMECADQQYDMIVLSLVLNFVTDPCKRADMLMKCEQIIKDDGILFIILPRPCVDNSRYLTHRHFTLRIMRTLGFELVTHHMSPKLAFYQFTLARRRDYFPYVRRSLLKDGDDMNNFSIIIRIEPGQAKTGKPTKSRQSTRTDGSDDANLSEEETELEDPKAPRTKPTRKQIPPPENSNVKKKKRKSIDTPPSKNHKKIKL